MLTTNTIFISKEIQQENSQKINALQSSFRLIPTLHFSLLFILYIDAKMMQINNKLQKSSILNNTAALLFWLCILVITKPQLDVT